MDCLGFCYSSRCLNEHLFISRYLVLVVSSLNINTCFSNLQKSLAIAEGSPSSDQRCKSAIPFLFLFRNFLHCVWTTLDPLFSSCLLALLAPSHTLLSPSLVPPSLPPIPFHAIQLLTLTNDFIVSPSFLLQKSLNGKGRKSSGKRGPRTECRQDKVQI